MKGQYAIAKYIPMKVRRQMVAVKYVGLGGSVPRCKDGKCPMGWLPDLPNLTRTPAGSEIARWLKKNGTSGARNKPSVDLLTTAWDFIDDFDGGKIKNLRKALGVPK